MHAPLSIVIPTLNATEEIGPTLASLAPGLQAGLIRELVISDGGSTDEIETVAEELGAHYVSGRAGRGGQLARGAVAAKGDWLLFLHADTRLPEGWVDAVSRHLQAAPDKAAVFQLKYDESSFGARLVGGWGTLRTRLFAQPYGDQGLLISRALYDAIGGYPDQPLMEDIEIVRRLGRARLTMLPLPVETSFVRYAKEGWIRRGLRNWICLFLYYWGVPVEKIAERYRG